MPYLIFRLFVARVRRVHEPGVGRGVRGSPEAAHEEAAAADHAERGQHHPHTSQGRLQIETLPISLMCWTLITPPLSLRPPSSFVCIKCT